MTQESEPKSREPIFNVPLAVLATVVVLVLVHVVRMFFLTDEQDAEVILAFAFIPARFGTDAGITGAFPGGLAADLWSFFTYAFLHADLMHLVSISRGLYRSRPRWRAASARGAIAFSCW